MNDNPDTRSPAHHGDRRPTSGEPREPQTRVRGTKARAGEGSGQIWVLLIVSTGLAAAALLGAWWYYFG